MEVSQLPLCDQRSSVQLPAPSLLQDLQQQVLILSDVLGMVQRTVMVPAHQLCERQRREHRVQAALRLRESPPDPTPAILVTQANPAIPALSRARSTKLPRRLAQVQRKANLLTMPSHLALPRLTRISPWLSQL